MPVTKLEIFEFWSQIKGMRHIDLLQWRLDASNPLKESIKNAKLKLIH